MPANDSRERLLRVLYRLEEPRLQRNAWNDLRFRVSELIEAASASGSSSDSNELLQA